MIVRGYTDRRYRGSPWSDPDVSGMDPIAAAGATWDDRRVTTVARPRVTRRRTGRLLGGVCGGLAASLGVDVGVMRFAVVLLGASGGAGVVLYALLWLSLPESDEPTVPRHAQTASSIANVHVTALDRMFQRGETLQGLGIGLTQAL